MEFVKGAIETINEKRSIETRFCAADSGSYYRGYEEEKAKEAEKFLNYVKTLEGFIETNLNRANYINFKDNYIYYLINGWLIFGLPQMDEEKNKTFIKESVMYNMPYSQKVQSMEKIPTEEVEKLKAAQEENKQKFIKRLKTYYKKYNNKIETWTYYAD